MKNRKNIDIRIDELIERRDQILKEIDQIIERDKEILSTLLGKMRHKTELVVIAITALIIGAVIFVCVGAFMLGTWVYP